jgi:catechol 2,3-dioxygenase-like lactoylglutathione lyase family enzyme
VAVLRPHLALTASDVQRAVTFYSALFDTPPEKTRPGYAKFSVPTPSLNLARVQGERTSLGAFNHGGIQVGTTAEGARRSGAPGGPRARHFDEMNTSCCYARQDKIWVRDPDGTPWEVFVTHEDAEEHADTSCGCGGSESGGPGCCSEVQRCCT